jgi:hypothetical protein
MDPGVQLAYDFDQVNLLDWPKERQHHEALPEELPRDTAVAATSGAGAAPGLAAAARDLLTITEASLQLSKDAAVGGGGGGAREACMQQKQDVAGTGGVHGSSYQLLQHGQGAAGTGGAADGFIVAGDIAECVGGRALKGGLGPDGTNWASHSDAVLVSGDSELVGSNRFDTVVRYVTVAKMDVNKASALSSGRTLQEHAESTNSGKSSSSSVSSSSKLYLPWKDIAGVSAALKKQYHKRKAQKQEGRRVEAEVLVECCDLQHGKNSVDFSVDCHQVDVFAVNFTARALAG